MNWVRSVAICCCVCVAYQKGPDHEGGNIQFESGDGLTELLSYDKLQGIGHLSRERPVEEDEGCSSRCPSTKTSWDIFKYSTLTAIVISLVLSAVSFGYCTERDCSIPHGITLQTIINLSYATLSLCGCMQLIAAVMHYTRSRELDSYMFPIAELIAKVIVFPFMVKVAGPKEYLFVLVFISALELAVLCGHSILSG